MPDNLAWIVVVAGTLLVVALVALALARRRRAAAHPAAAETAAADGEPTAVAVRQKRAAVVVNPTKFTDFAPVRMRIDAVCRASGWAEPLYLETTAEDPGQGQTRQALAQGVDVVCAMGGDGTVRCVAEVLAGTDTPIGLLPAGTGNLLARNIDLPLDNLEGAVRTALEGSEIRVDVGRVRIDTDGDEGQVTDHVFLVMVGMGFDAHIMAGAPEDLKNKVGWPAYVVSGVRNLRGERFKVDLTVGDGEPVRHRARTVVVGNCGKLMAGITLLPDARIDDGLLDALVLSPKTIVGWAAVASRVVRRTTATNPRIDHWAAEHFTVSAVEPEVIQVDGDVIRAARVMRAVVDPGALRVRVG